MDALTPLDPADWSPRHARHLLNRAGFGVPHTRAADLADMGVKEAVKYLVQFHKLSDQFSAPDFLIQPTARRRMAKTYPDLSDEELRMRYAEYQMMERMAHTQLKAWWLQRMATTPRPLEEKLTLFWHGHFATSAAKVKQSQYNYDLNQVFRKNAAGNLKKLTIAVGQSESMLDYLDNRRSTKAHPNENWARELMELFTLGQGNYTEDDIKAAARAFTGWTFGRKGFTYATSKHDDGEKSFMGRTGNFDGWNIIDIIFEQSATAEFFAGKLWAYFAHEHPDPKIVQALAAVLRENDYELRPMLRKMFATQAFYSEQAMGTQIKSPAQFLVRLCADLGIEDVPYERVADACRTLGQDLFYPPNVKGWDGNRAWINANALLARYNMPPLLIQASIGSARKRAMGKAEESERMMMQPAMMADGAATAAEEPLTFRDVTREWRKNIMAALKQKLEDQPAAARKEANEIIRKGAPAQRRALLTKYGIQLPPWEAADPAWLFDDLQFDTAGECINALADRFLAVPPAADQRALLLTALGFEEPGTPAKPEDISVDNRHAVLHLIGSMAEYQIC